MPAAPPAAADTQLCDKYGSLRLQAGGYIVRNNLEPGEGQTGLGVRSFSVSG